jgi:hypothetical protein
MGGRVFELAEGWAPAAALPGAENGEFKLGSGDFTGGVRSGVNGTPTFFIDGLRHDGPFDFESLVNAIDAAMSPAKRDAKGAIR